MQMAYTKNLNPARFELGTTYGLFNKLMSVFHASVLLLLGCQTQSESAFHFSVFLFFPCHEKSCLSLPCLVVSLCIESSVRILLGLRGLG